MKTMIRSTYGLCALSLGLFSFNAVAASEGHEKEPAKAAAAATKVGVLVPARDLDPAWLEKARKAYPLRHCLTSDEELGSMGKSPEYAYRVEGQPDRLVIFCCEGCEEDFLKEPAKYLAKLKPKK